MSLPPISSEPVVLGVDKTLKLCYLHVTKTVCKIFLLSNGIQVAIACFLVLFTCISLGIPILKKKCFHYLAGVPFQEPSSPTQGSEEEAEMVHAIEKEFQQTFAFRFSCSRHLIAFLTKSAFQKRNEIEFLVLSFQSLTCQTITQSCLTGFSSILRVYPPKCPHILREKSCHT